MNKFLIPFLMFSTSIFGKIIGNDAVYSTESTQKFDAGLPNISARTVDDLNYFDFFSDLIYWHATEANGWAQSNSSTNPSTINFYTISFDWDPGLKVGGGYNMGYDQWDTQFFYTWFNTSSEQSISIDSGVILSPFIGSALSLTGVYQSASVNWGIHFNMFDLELGRSFLISKGFSTRPFIGVKGGWIHQKIETDWHNPSLPIFEIPISASENLQNNFWGVGPKIGMNTKMLLGNALKGSFSLFGDFSSAFMWGHWSFQEYFQNSLGENIPSTFDNKNLGALMFGALMGFGWDVNFNNDKSHFAVRLGYEIQDWFDQYQIYDVATGTYNNSLFLQGAVLDFRFDF